MKIGPAKKPISTIIWLVTWLALFLSECLTKGWKACFLFLLWFAFALSPLPDKLPYEFTVFISYFLLAGAGLYALNAFRKIILPNDIDVLRQLEQTNGLENRPLRSLRDKFPKKDRSNPESNRLWHQHLENLQRNIPSLTYGQPKPIIASIDPFALRYLLLLMVIVFSVSGHKTWKQASYDAIWPDQNSIFIATTIDAWITPPSYTGLSTILITEAPDVSKTPEASAQKSALAKRKESQLAIAAGSQLILQVSGQSHLPDLHINGTSVPVEFKQQASNSYRLDMNVEQSGDYQLILDGDVEKKWNFNILSDFPPEASFMGGVRSTNRHSLKIPYSTSDDYGVTQVSIKATKTNNVDADAAQESIEFSLLKSKGDQREIASNHFLDLTAHPWAGLQVKLELIARDAIGQTGASHSQLIVLPQRVFNHPVARKIIAVRRRISGHMGDDYLLPAQRLMQIASAPHDFNDDRATFLALTITARRLVAPDHKTQLNASLKLLWDIALYLEEGEVASSLAKLQSAEKRLLEAMNEGADAAVIQQLLDELELAMADYLQALAEDPYTQNPNDTQSPDQGLSQKLMENTNVGEMMKQLRELLKMGMTEAARDLLAQIQNIMQNLRKANADDMPQEAMDAVEMLQEMDEIIREQKDLMERSYDRAMGRETDKNTSQNPSTMDSKESSDFLKNRQMKSLEDLARQTALQERLEKLKDRYKSTFGENPPEEFGAGESAMGMARDSLEYGSNHQATQSQGKALDALQRSLTKMESAFVERFMGQGNQTISNDGTSDSQGKDPFGRPVDNPNAGTGLEDVKIPSKSKMGRARSIQQELRRRFNDPSRNKEERNYIERLLKPF